MSERRNQDFERRPERPIVSASILSADFGVMAQECADVLGKGADWLHVDVMDGHFVPNLTMGRDMIAALRKHFPDAFLDVHLMVDAPDRFVEPFAAAGADLFNFQAEVCYPVRPGGLRAEDLIGQVKAAGMRVGMTINPGTPAASLVPWLEELDLVLVMSVVPGASGQAFIEPVLEQVRWLRERLPERTRLEIDGGINRDTAPKAIEAGADVLVSASALFGAEDREAYISFLKQ